MFNKLELSGSSSHTGFIINYKNKNTMNSESTLDYDKTELNETLTEQDTTKLTKNLFIVTSVMFIFFCLKMLINYFLGWYLIPFWWQCMFIIVLSIIFSILGILRFQNKTFKRISQWHACEHKLIYLLRKHKKVTIESLRKAKKTSIYCGTTPSFCILTLILVYSFFYGVGNPPPENIETTTNVIKLGPFLSILICLCFITISFFINSSIILLMQRIFYLSEPKECQYMETLRVGKLIEEKIKLLS